MEPIVEDIIEIIPEKTDNDEVDSEFEYDEDDDAFMHVGNELERVVDALGGLFVSSEGQTVADVLAKMSDTLEKHAEILEKQNEIIEKQNKVLFRLAKVIEETKK